jgi:hypothetical protein
LGRNFEAHFKAFARPDINSRRSIGDFGLDAVIRPIFSNGSFDALSCRSRPEIRSFGPERLLSPKADAGKNSVYFCYADFAVIWYA